MKNVAFARASTQSARSWSALALVLVALAGCNRGGGAASTASPAPTAEAALPNSPGTYKVGDKVDIEWKGKYYPGEILATNADKYRVHYTGWSSSWDEDVTANRLRAPTGAAVVAPEPAAPVAAVKTVAAWKPGSSVDVNWKGTWYQGRVLSVSNGQYRIRYIGWASSWDETVPASRLRAPTGSAKRGSGPT